MSSKQRPADARPDAGRRHRARTWVVLAVVAVLVLGAGGFGLYRVLNPTTAEAERTVTVSAQTVRNTVGTTGTLQPKQWADLSFTSSGTVAAVDVSVGDSVKKGEVLARIDDDELRADLDGAEADLQAAEDDLTEQQDNGGTDAAISAAKSQVAVKQSAVGQAESALADAALRSTISGTVALVDVVKGDQVGSTGGSADTGSGSGSASSTAAVTVISTDSYVVDTSVGSADLAKIKKGLQAEITPTGATQPIYGTVASVGVMASTSTSSSGSSGSSTATFPVTIDVTEDQKGLFAGASATVSIIVEQRDNVLTVPTVALGTADGKTVVQKLVDGAKVPTAVTVGASYGASTEITKGLAAGDQVVISFGRIPTGTGSAGTGTRGFGGSGGFGGGNGGFGGTGQGQSSGGNR